MVGLQQVGLIAGAALQAGGLQYVKTYHTGSVFVGRHQRVYAPLRQWQQRYIYRAAVILVAIKQGVVACWAVVLHHTLQSRHIGIADVEIAQRIGKAQCYRIAQTICVDTIEENQILYRSHTCGIVA